MDISAQIIGGRGISASEALDLAEKLPLDELCAEADKVRSHFLGKKVDTCAIMNARSGRCSENCKWCAQSAAYSTGCDVYGYVSPEAALERAKEAAARGIRRFSLVTSGRTVSDADLKGICDAFRLMSRVGAIELCGSFGLLKKSQIALLKEAGMTRLHCNLETAPSYFPKLCTTHTIADKLATIAAAREAGMSICSGGIIGMGESRAQRAELAETLSKIGADSIPVNILQPIKGTPLENTPPLPTEEILTAFAIFRLLNPRAHIRFAGGRAAIRGAQEKALRSGVSAVLMGDMLTTVGSSVDEDFKMLTRLGYEF